MGRLSPKGITEAHLKAANIGEDYWDTDFGNFQGPKGPAKRVYNYLKNLEEMKEKGVGLLLVGPNGPGKTTLAMIVLKYLSRAGWDVFATSLGEIVETIQRSWKDDEEGESSDFIEKCRHAKFLVIDDVGKEHRGQSGFVQTTFDNLIRYRVQHRLPTILTTNFTKSELSNTYGESSISLLEGKLIPITVNGDDHRRTILKSEIRSKI